MERILLLVCFAVLILFNPAHASDSREPETSISVIGFINTLKSENVAYYSGRKIEFFSGLAKGQSPIATVVTCSDSRVHTNMMDPNPEGKFFMVPNICNQLTTGEG